MPETVKIFNRQIPKPWLYAGGAAVGGIVVYAWWSKGGGFTAEEEEPLFDEFGNPIAGPTPGLESPNVLDSNLEVNAGTGFADNAEWSRFASDYLEGRGHNAQAVISAIGKFLQRKPLNLVEADLVSQAVAVAGWPPDDRPWTIIQETTAPPASTGLTAPANFQATGGVSHANLSWSPVTGATSYEVQLKGLAWRDVGNVTSFRVDFPPQNRGVYTFLVRAVGPNNNKGPHSSATATVTNSGGGTLPAPGARVTRTTRSSVTITWDRVPGAKRYEVTREGGGRGVDRGCCSHTSSGLRPNTTYTFIVRAVDSSGKGGVSNVLTARTKA